MRIGNLAILILVAIGMMGATLPGPQSGKVQVYLLMGQSNMAGRGRVTAEYKNMQHERVIMLTKDKAWTIARHPIHFDKPDVAGVGPGLSFGIEMARAYPNDTIALVPCAVGGTSINKWAPGAYDKSSKTRPYDDALARIKTAMKKGTVRGVIWLQGEADSGRDSAVNTYLGKLTTLIHSIRKETGNRKLPWIAGELGTYRQRYVIFNRELANLPLRVKHTSVITSEGLVHKGDTTHFDSKSADLYGKRFAADMLRLQEKKLR
ncbi:sialate O-acetylesterase [Pedobacter sp. SYP-B3415]|uniref:sialate O-acetylesterase n=1 Tax=Pedobacter sp. SYP-B3415 TaxID=2496641 RepID=UPI00101E1B84|nr:sialate O-acetylesterase [Pedobacter sp. SYP-B3415]